MNKIIDTLLQRTLLFSYSIVFDSTNSMSVAVRPHMPVTRTGEYGRLWAAYHVRVLESLGFPTNVDALLASAMIEKIVSKPFSEKIDCFQRAGLPGVVRYTEDSLAGYHHITGHYYRKGQKHFLLAELPVDITSKYLIYGSIGLLQYTLNRCGRNHQEILLVNELVENVLSFLRKDSGYDTSLLGQLPDTAYGLARRKQKLDENGDDISLQAD